MADQTATQAYEARYRTALAQHEAEKELIHLAAKAYFGSYYRGQVQWVTLAGARSGAEGFWEALTEGQSHDDLLGWQRFDPLHYDDDAGELDKRLTLWAGLDKDAIIIDAAAACCSVSQSVRRHLTHAAAEIGRGMP